MKIDTLSFATVMLGSTLFLAAACGNGGNGSTTTGAATMSAGSGGQGGATGSTTAASTTGTTGTTGTGGAPGCSQFFATTGMCGQCTEQKCCPELTACKGSQDCLDCVTGVKDVKADPACTAAATKALLGAIDTCDTMKCTNECLNPDMDTAVCTAKETQTGACATDTTKFPCNPITNAGCAAGEQCDYAIGASSDDKFQCFPLDDAPTALCEDCSVHYCGVGLTCIGTCGRYCCDDSDCGTGVCNKTTAEVDKPGLGAVGICVAGP